MQLARGRGRHFVVLDQRDNVATVLDDFEDEMKLSNGMVLQGRIPMGHKISLRPISAGAPVIKYGVEIGRATSDIAEGEHVHVHNCA